MISTPTTLDHIAAIQCDLKSIRDQYPDQWDSDRVLNFARNLAVRSIQVGQRLDKKEAAAKVDDSLSQIIERQFNSGRPVAVDQIKAKTDWAMIVHCINLIDERAVDSEGVSPLEMFAARMSAWHTELRSALTLLGEGEVQTLAYMLQEMIAYGDLRDLPLIDDLPAHQRSQVYGKLTRVQMVELGRLKGECSD